MKLKTYEELNEYRSQNANVYEIMKKEPHVMGKPVFTDDKQMYQKTQQKIDADLKGYEKHMAESVEKMKEWTNRPGVTKGDLDWYARAQKARELAFKIVKEAADFMQEFNAEYNKRIDDLTGEDHTLVAKAIYDLQDIYPYQLIQDAGMLKRLKKMKYDSEFVGAVLKWTESIVKRYEILKEGGKVLGKTEAQIAGARKLAASMRSRWGSY